MPGQERAVVELTRWEPREGYLQTFDQDGYETEYPDPDAKPDDFSWLWYGKGDGWTLSLTVRKGIVVGRISSASGRYGIEARPNRVTQLGHINSSFWKTHADDVPQSGEHKDRQTVSSEPLARTSISTLDAGQGLKGTGFTWDFQCTSPISEPQNQNIDILFLYTENLRNFLGGTAATEATIQGTLDSANIALRNTNIDIVSYRAAAMELFPFNPAAFNYDTRPIDEALDKLSGRTNSTSPPYCEFTSDPNTYVKTRRAAVGADVVALSRLDPSLTCGAAWVQRGVESANGCFMDPGISWAEKFGYLIFKPQCDADRLNLAHELGHIVGMEHDPVNSDTSRGGFYPSCPWSYGNRYTGSWIPADLRFRTVMAYPNNDPNAHGEPGPDACSLANGDYPQIDAYTNWNLQWAGSALGIQPLPLVPGASRLGVQTPPLPGQPKAHAYDTIRRIGPLVAKSRDLSLDPAYQTIFKDGF